MTAGGTREPIDPVRVLTNRSSGRQGHAVAEVAARRGARRSCSSTASPLALDAAVAPLDRAPSTSRRRAEMLDVVLEVAADADVVVMAAAVSDFRPSTRATTKLRRDDGVPALDLEPTDDVLAAVVARAATRARSSSASPQRPATSLAARPREARQEGVRPARRERRRPSRGRASTTRPTRS